MLAKSSIDRSHATTDPSARALTINAAFFDEVKEAHHEVDALAREILQLASRPDWTEPACQELASQLNRMVELVRWYFSLEEAYGYFEDPVFVNAVYGQRVSDLRAEHKGLLTEIDRLSERAARLLYNGRLPDSADAILSRFGGFRDQLDRHEVRERELITEGYSTDIGCGD